jgi:pimeloyl-ACP methyl ester carboxylesterase
MSSLPIQSQESAFGATEYVFFAGDRVQLAGQMDYPALSAPPNGFPLLFIIQHSTCNNRSGYLHYARLGAEAGFAVFRWDKRGTGNSGSGIGDGIVDALHAYKAALAQPQIDQNRTVILAQNEGTLVLHDLWAKFKALAVPRGVVLVGNMLDERAIVRLDVPVTVVISKNDWNAWQIYARKAAQAHHARYPQWPAAYYVAPNTNRRLMYEHGGAFHRGASEYIRQWIESVCQTSA